MRSAARVDFEPSTQDLSLSDGARLFLNSVESFLLRCAAALRGILNAASRKVNCSGEGGQRALRGVNHGQPNNSFNPTGNSVPFIRKIEGLVRFFPAG